MAKRKKGTLNDPAWFQPQRSETSVSVLPSDEQTKQEDISLLPPPSDQNSNIKVTGSHRRVWCFEEGTSALEKARDQVSKPPTIPQNEDHSYSVLHSLQAAVGASQYIENMQSTDSNEADSNAPAVEDSGSQSSENSSEEMGTPRALFLPAKPELQGCSPGSEAGSESSVSLAAHTQRMLSGESIANTGSATPLKDNTQQMKSRSRAKQIKLEETEECEKDTQSPPAPLKKEKIKGQNKEKLMDSFPADMDVDTFLSSLRYDE